MTYPCSRLHISASTCSAAADPPVGASHHPRPSLIRTALVYHLLLFVEHPYSLWCSHFTKYHFSHGIFKEGRSPLRHSVYDLALRTASFLLDSCGFSALRLCIVSICSGQHSALHLEKADSSFWVGILCFKWQWVPKLKTKIPLGRKRTTTSFLGTCY